MNLMFLSCKSKRIFGNMPYLKNNIYFHKQCIYEKIDYTCVFAQMHTTRFPWALYTASSFFKIHFSGFLASCRGLEGVGVVQKNQDISLPLSFLQVAFLKLLYLLCWEPQIPLRGSGS